MKLWKNRPLFSASCVLIGTSLAGFFIIPQGKLLIFALCLLTAMILTLLCLIRRRTSVPFSVKRYVMPILLLLCAALALGHAYLSTDRKTAALKRYEGQRCEAEATVLSCKNSGAHMSTYVLSVHTVNNTPQTYNALLTCYYVSDLQPGYTVRLTAEAVSLSDAAKDVYETYHLMSEGIFVGFVSMTETDVAITDESPDSLALGLTRHRYRLSLAMERCFGEEAAGLPPALLLGERSHLSDTVRRDFARTGVSHLLAISGLHMTLLFGLLALLFKCFALPPRVRALLLSVLATAYLIYLGFPPSATRAVIMLGMTYLSSLCFAGADPLTSLGLSGAVILLVSPTAVADAGFWMSFSATLGLLTLTRVLPVVKKKGLGRWISWLGGLAAGTVAVTFSLWITAPVMGEMSLLSSPMTLLLTPLTGILLVLSPIALLLSPTSAGALLVTAVQGVSHLMTKLCEVCAEPTHAVISLTHPAIPWVAALTVLATLFLLGLSLPKKSLALIPSAAGWAAIAVLITVQTLSHSGEVRVSYLVPSTTSEMLVMTRGQEAVICELSSGSRRAFLTAAEEASAAGATELSAVILTDYHSATASALLQLTERETVRNLWLPKPTCEEDYFLLLACLEVSARTGTPAVIYDHGDVLTLFGEASLSVQRTSLSRSVQPVLLLTLTTPTQKLTVCGRSILESDLALPALVAMGESDTVILSNKGPVMKEPLFIPWTPNVREVYLANKVVAAHLSPEAYPHEDVTVTVGQARFYLPLHP